MRKTAFVIFAIVSLSLFSFSQSTGGRLDGRVTDVTGAVIQGATVVLTGPGDMEMTTVSDAAGSFSVGPVPAGTYSLRVESTGFAVYEDNAVRIAPGGTTDREITLDIEVVETEVSVSDENVVDTAPDTNASAIILRDEDIDALPDDEEDLQAALQALAGPGAGPNGGAIYVDGFSGGGLPPRDTIREIRINSNPFSSEFDQLGYGRIEILTKPGTDRFRGSIEAEFEDESLNSRNPFLDDRPSYQRREFEGRFGGPLAQERASFFVNVGIENADNNSLINALVLDPNLNPVSFQSSSPSTNSEIEFDPRIDYQINENNTFIARYGLEREKRSNAGIGGFNLPSRAYETVDTEHAIRLSETAILSPKIVNETRFQYLRRRSTESGDSTAPTIRVLDAFTGGGANIGNAFSNEDLFEFQNYTSFLLEEHTLKVGGRFRHVKLLDASPGNFAGTFTFTSIDQYRDAILGIDVPRQFTIAGGDPEAGVSQSDVGVFFQDDWRVNPNLTLSFGIRYENQTNISSHYDVAPRFGFAFAPFAGNGEAKTVIRGGYGIFYDRYDEGLTLQARRFNGVSQQRFIVDDPAILGNVIFTLDGVTNVPSVSDLAAFAQEQTTRTASPDIRSPYTAQLAFSVERQLPAGTTVSLTYLNTKTRRLLRSRNINAPLEGARPFPDEGNIFQYESNGRLNQDQMIVNVRSRFSDFNIFANYSLNFAKSDTDGAGSFPVNQYDLDGEYGRSSLDSRHRFVLGGSYDAPLGIRLRPFLIFRSGSPFNITDGTDSNGDTLFNERPTFAALFARCGELGIAGSFCDSSGISDLNSIVPRNYGTGPGFFILNMRASKSFSFGPSSEGGDSSSGGGGRRGGRFGGPFGTRGRGGGGGGGDKKYSLEFTVFVRNILNRTNLNSPVGNLSSSFFGQSLSTAGGFGFGGGGSSAGNRRIELEIEFEF